MDPSEYNVKDFHLILHLHNDLIQYVTRRHAHIYTMTWFSMLHASMYTFTHPDPVLHASMHTCTHLIWPNKTFLRWHTFIRKTEQKRCHQIQNPLAKFSKIFSGGPQLWWVLEWSKSQTPAHANCTMCCVLWNNIHTWRWHTEIPCSLDFTLDLSKPPELYTVRFALIAYVLFHSCHCHVDSAGCVLSWKIATSVRTFDFNCSIKGGKNNYV